MIEQILHDDFVLLFLIITLGCFLGKLSISDVNLSSAGGVLFIALAFGNFHFTLPDNISSLGFAFFIYAIGFGAGPRFFQTFRINGIKYGLVAVFVAVLAAGIAFLCAYIFKISIMLLPGILAGALTSTSTLAAAYEITKDPIISVGYGITYPFGLLGLLLMIQFLPKLLKVNLKEEAAKIHNIDLDEDEEENKDFQCRVYCVRNPNLSGKSLADLQFHKTIGVMILTIKHGDKIELAKRDSVLEMDDHIMVEGSLSNLIGLESIIGPEVMDREIAEHRYSTERAAITNHRAINRSVKDLRLASDLGVIITRIQRGGIDMKEEPDFKLERGDIVTLVGSSNNLQHAIALLGRRENKIYETDIFTFSSGLVLGILLGMVKLPVINTSIGNAGGLLFMGILLGYLRNFGPFSGRVPMAARYILQELGLLLFMAGIGTKAGEGLIEHLLSAGAEIFAAGVIITTITLIATLFFCRYVLRFDWNTSFGATTGGVTSTVALKIVTREAESQYAVLGYAGVYAFANILLTILGQIMLLFK